MPDLARAHELFDAYLSSRFGMSRDGDLDEYLSHNVSREQELV